jgi:hypothetical protein
MRHITPQIGGHAKENSRNYCSCGKPLPEILGVTAVNSSRWL